ncbi:MAG: ADP-ribosylglycohydrolase family protein [Oliverpabstia sp.]|nr:ADP-ribosylglycohydrolase family protein [Oliverpabstia sp.]
MILNLETFRDKLAGCWAGKNIGGVLGAPFEGIRKIHEVDFYTQDLSMGPPPNDDLDLQIVWLAAVERYGRNVNADILADYWLSYIIPNWVEYGTAKANLRAGLMPPLCGEVDNTYKDSCGCYIRSEVWACLAPGHPEIAARYAYEDAIVDHAGEGMYGEIFFAALQSAAFVENDTKKLIEIGLSYIPEESVTAKAIRKASECYENHVEFYEARKQIHNTAPGTFGIQSCKIQEIPKEGNEGMEIGKPGFDAPENVAFTIAGWLYGEGDFGRSICLANSCGEDTDCTCATLGATMGIIAGASNLPEKWTKPLDDKIATMCIDKTSRGIWVPETATELADRILRVVPGFLGQELCDIFAENGMQIICREDDELYCEKTTDYLHRINGANKSHQMTLQELCRLSPYVIRYDFPAFSMLVDYKDSAFYKKGEARKIRVQVVNSHTMNQQQWVKLTLYLPEGAEVNGSNQVELPLNNLVGACAETEFEISTEFYNGSRLEFVIDASLVGRHSFGCAKVTLLCEK